ncbi:MAG: response regulator transcription factor [Acidimicrobiales bacterium]
MSVTTSSTAATEAPPLRLLLIEDEPAMAEIVSTALTARGFSVTVAASGRAGLDEASAQEPDLVVLDLGLPDLDGIEVCRQLRRWFSNPIIVLSADGAEDRKVVALDEGADDYVTKPFSMPELLARLRVAVRHRGLLAMVVDPAVLTLGDVVIDTGARSVTVDGQPIDLPKRQFDLLEMLARQPGKVVTHGRILGRLWGTSDAGGANSLRVHISHLRRSLGEGPQRPQLLVEPGVGYRLSLAESE